MATNTKFTDSGRSYLGYTDAQNKLKAGKIVKPDSKDPADKEDKWYYLQWAEYIYAQYAANSCLVPYGGFGPLGKSFDLLRAYALGKQDNRIYMNILDPCEPNKSEGYININWDNVQILPKFRDLVRGKLMAVEFTAQTQAVDITAQKERLEKVSKLKLAANPQMKAFAERTGLKPKEQLPEGIETPEEIEILEKLGGVRLQYEIMMQDAMQCTEYESNWKTIKDMILDDIIDLNICGVKIYTEAGTGKVKERYVDPVNLICPLSNFPDHRDIQWAGEIRKMTLSDLRMEADIAEDDLKMISQKYSNRSGLYNGINTNNDFDYTVQPDNNGGAGRFYNSIRKGYDNMIIDVMDFCFIAKDVEKYVVGCRKDGTMIYDKVQYDSKLGPKDIKRGKDFDEKEIEYVYTCKWVIGTNIVFDCRKEYDIVREGYNGVKQARLPYIIYSDRTPSLIERCVSLVDDIQLAVLKKRNLLAKMAPGPRMVIDKSILEDSVTIGSKTYNTLEMVGLFPKTGVMIVESKSEWSDDMNAANKNPIQFLPSGISEDIQLLLQEVAWNVEQIRQVTGINEVTDGTSQQGDMLVKVMQGLQAATNTALRPLYRVYEGLKEAKSKYTCLKWQVAVIGGEIDIAYIPIGDSTLKAVKLTKDLYDYDFGIMIVMAPSEEERQLLLQDIIAKKERQEIGPEDYFVLFKMIRSGDIDKAQLYMSKAIARQKAIQQQMAIQQMQAQAQAQAQLAQATEMEKQKSLQMEFQMKLELEKAKAEEERKTLQLKIQLETIKNKTQAGLQLENDIVNKGMDAIVNNQTAMPQMPME